MVPSIEHYILQLGAQRGQSHDDYQEQEQYYHKRVEGMDEFSKFHVENGLGDKHVQPDRRRKRANLNIDSDFNTEPNEVKAERTDYGNKERCLCHYCIRGNDGIRKNNIHR